MKIKKNNFKTFKKNFEKNHRENWNKNFSKRSSKMPVEFLKLNFSTFFSRSYLINLEAKFGKNY